MEATKGLKIRRLHLSKSLRYGKEHYRALKRLWMATSHVAVHNRGLVSWETVSNWNVLEEEVLPGGWHLVNGLGSNRETVEGKFRGFLEAAF